VNATSGIGLAGHSVCCNLRVVFVDYQLR